MEQVLLLIHPKSGLEGGEMPPCPLFPTVLFLHHQSLPSNPSRELLNSSQMFALHFHKREGKHLESLPTNVPSKVRELLEKSISIPIISLVSCAKAPMFLDFRNEVRKSIVNISGTYIYLYSL